MSEPTPLSAEPWTPTEVAALRRYAENRPKTFREFYADSIDPFRMLATIDAQATEIAALKGALESIVSAIDAHHPKYRHGPFALTRTEVEAARRVLAGKEAQGGD